MCWSILFRFYWCLYKFKRRNNSPFNFSCCFLSRWIINSHQNCCNRLLRKLRKSQWLIFWSRHNWKDSRWNFYSRDWRNLNCSYFMSCPMSYCSDNRGMSRCLRLFTYWSWSMVDWRYFNMALWWVWIMGSSGYFMNLGNRRRRMEFFMVKFRIGSMKNWSRSNDRSYSLRPSWNHTLDISCCFRTYWGHSFRGFPHFFLTPGNRWWIRHCWGCSLLSGWNWGCLVNCCDLSCVMYCWNCGGMILRWDCGLSIVWWIYWSMANWWGRDSRNCRILNRSRSLDCMDLSGFMNSRNRCRKNQWLTNRRDSCLDMNSWNRA